MSVSKRAVFLGISAGGTAAIGLALLLTATKVEPVHAYSLSCSISAQPTAQCGQYTIYSDVYSSDYSGGSLIRHNATSTGEGGTWCNSWAQSPGFHATCGPSDYTYGGNGTYYPRVDGDMEGGATCSHQVTVVVDCF